MLGALSEIDTVLSVTEGGTTPSLKLLYDARLERSRQISFSPFADFFLLALANSRFGSGDEQWIGLAEGRTVKTPAAKSSEVDLLHEMDSPPVPRHTMRITVRSTLPQFG